MSKFIVLALMLVLVAFFLYRSNINKAQAEQNIALGNEFLAKNKQQANVQTTPSGLQYQVLQQGTGTVHPTATDTVTVHYHGTLIDGTVFDSSIEREQTISFALNRVIPGWTEGLQLMVTGEKTRLFIPATLGYGNNSAGKIPAGSVLIFDVELLAIN